jgi:hypothetical protein
MAATVMTKTAAYIDSTPLLNDPLALRARAAQDGYLYFRKLLDPQQVRSVRRQVLEVARKHGWVDESAPLEDGIAKPGACFVESIHPEWKPYYCDIQRLRDFHALALSPALIGMFEKVFNEPVLLHSRNICRLIFPNSLQYTTPAHQDYVHIKGTHDTWTTWIPGSDCPEELGGLAILPGSHKLGPLPTRAAYGAGGSGVDVPEDSIWHLGDLKCGDVLTFHSLTVHQGRDNVTPNRLRISCDFRYQPRSHPLVRSSMEPHHRFMPWDEIYAGWPANDPVKYYWKDWQLNYV